MVKTLRITSVIAAVLAVVFFAFPAVFGVRGDQRTERFWNSAGVIEKFNKLRSGKSAKARSQVSPLVKQAEAFALYINPPKPPKPTTTKITTPGPRPTLISDPKPKVVSAKFTLVGTTYYALHPELSLALIDEPGKGLRWVRQSGKVGHLIIEQVKDGLVVVRDGQRTLELVPERAEKRSLLKGAASSARTGSKSALPTSIGPKATPAVAGAGISPRPQVVPSKKAAASTISSRHPSSRPPQMSAEKSTALDKLMSELKAARGGGQSDKIDSKRSNEEDVTALMGKLISDFRATRISAEEAKRLERMGKDLKDTTEDPNRPRSRKIERPKSSREPNSPPEK